MAPNSGYRCNPIREKQEITTIRRQLYNPVVIQPKRSKEPREARNQEKQGTKKSKKLREARNQEKQETTTPIAIFCQGKLLIYIWTAPLGRKQKRKKINNKN